jgi:gliding motility-associated-like protein
VIGVKKYELSVYNRWGELLFESKDPKIGWDGYYRDKLCQQDIYVWKIKATSNAGKAIIKTGDVTLLR